MHYSNNQTYSVTKQSSSIKQDNIVEETKKIIQKNYIEPIDMSGSYIERAYVQ